MPSKWWLLPAALAIVGGWAVGCPAAGLGRVEVAAFTNQKPAAFSFQVRQRDSGRLVSQGRVPAGQRAVLKLPAGGYELLVTNRAIADRPMRRFAVTLLGTGATVQRRARFEAGRLLVRPAQGRTLPAGRLTVQALSKVPPPHQAMGPNVTGMGVDDPRKPPPALGQGPGGGEKHPPLVLTLSPGQRPELWLEPGLYRVAWAPAQSAQPVDDRPRLVIIQKGRDHKLVLEAP